MEVTYTATLNAQRHNVLHRAALVMPLQSVRQAHSPGGRRTAIDSLTSEFITGRVVERNVGRCTARNVATVTAKNRFLDNSVAN